MGSLYEVMKQFKIDYGDDCTVLKTTELYTSDKLYFNKIVLQKAVQCISLPVKILQGTFYLIACFYFSIMSKYSRYNKKRNQFRLF